MSPIIFYPDMKIKYTIEVINLRHQADHITPEKIQIFLEYGADPENERFFLVIFGRREIELISDGNKIIEIEVI